MLLRYNRGIGVCAGVLLFSLCSVPVFAAGANSTSIDAVFSFRYDSATDGDSNDASFNVEFDGNPEGFNEAVYHTDFNGGSSSSGASHTVGGLDLEDDYEEIESVYGYPYDTSFPDIVVEVSATAHATNPGSQGNVIATEWTLLPFYYFGDPTSLTVTFGFDIAWDVVHTIGTSGFVATDLSIIAYLLDDEYDPAQAIAQYDITPCPGCLAGDGIALGQTHPGTSMIDETSVFGGPVNSGTFDLVIPDTDISGYFTLLIETKYGATAVGQASPVPAPAAVWLMAPALAALGAYRRRRMLTA